MVKSKSSLLSYSFVHRLPSIWIDMYWSRQEAEYGLSVNVVLWFPTLVARWGEDRYAFILAFLKEMRYFFHLKLMFCFLAICFFLDLTKPVKNDSYSKRNRSASRGAQIVPTEILLLVVIKVLSSRKSSNSYFGVWIFQVRFTLCLNKLTTSLKHCAEISNLFSWKQKPYWLENVLSLAVYH